MNPELPVENALPDNVVHCVRRHDGLSGSRRRPQFPRGETPPSEDSAARVECAETPHAPTVWGVEKRTVDVHLPRFTHAVSPISQSERCVHVNICRPPDECIPHCDGESVAKILCEDDVGKISVGATAQYDEPAQTTDSLSDLDTRI